MCASATSSSTASSDDSSSPPPVVEAPGKKKDRAPSEVLAAVAVAGIAFWAPNEETGYVLRLIGSVLALGTLLLANIGLEVVLKARATVNAPKKNAFEIVTKKVDVPTAPPGGIFEAACAMASHLKDFPVDMRSRVTSTENGFQVLTGTQRLRVKVLPGTAIGWEHGSNCWLVKRDEWIKAVQAAPRCANVMETEWMGVTSLPPADVFDAPPPLEAGSSCVRIDGVEKKPTLNGKLAVVTRAANEMGRVGVRPEGQKDSILLAQSKLQPLAIFDRRGISLPCLRAFFASLKHLLDGITCAEAIDSVIKPLTHSCKGSVATALGRRDAKDEAGRSYVGNATVFLCYAEDTKATDVFDIIERYASAQTGSLEDVYVWLDLLCTNHHGEDLKELPMIWWQTTFRSALKAIGSTCLALHPWDAAAPLKRSWCHWVLHCALGSDSKLTPEERVETLKEAKINVQVTSSESSRLDAALVLNMEAPMKQLDTRIEGWRKTALAPTDAQREKIEKAIEKSEGGYEEFSRKLADVLHKWLLDRAKAMLDAMSPEDRATSTLVDRVAKLLQEFGDLEAAEPLCREMVELKAKTLGETHVDTLEAINNCALLLHQLGKLSEAEPFSRRKLAGCRANLGDRHPDTITAIDTTSQLLSDLGKLNEALPLKRESLAEKRRTLGDRHPDTLLSVNNLAVLLNDLGRQIGDLRMLREAEPLKREALAGCREVLGNRHPHTLASVANLADLLMQLAPADPRALCEAEPLARESLAGTREVLGNGHPETLKSVGMLATLLTEAGHMHAPDSKERIAAFREAEPLYREAVQGFTQGLGQYHPTPLSYHHELARLLLDMNKLVDAENLSRDCLRGCRAALGDSHPETLIAITHLAAVLRTGQKLEEAVRLAREVRNGWREVERDAKVPRNTLTASNILAELLHSMGKNKEAEPLCKEVLNGFLRAVGTNHPFTVSAADNLSNVLRALNKGDEADKVLKQFGMQPPHQGVAEDGDEERKGGEPVANSKPASANGTSSPKKKKSVPIKDVTKEAEDVD